MALRINKLLVIYSRQHYPIFFPTGQSKRNIDHPNRLKKISSSCTSSISTLRSRTQLLHPELKQLRLNCDDGNPASDNVSSPKSVPFQNSLIQVVHSQRVRASDIHTSQQQFVYAKERNCLNVIHILDQIVD